MLSVFTYSFFTFCILIYFWKFYLNKREKGLPPGPGHIPILGSIPFLPKRLRSKRGLHIPKTLHYMTDTYGKVSCLYLGPIRTIVISDPKILREAFKLPELANRPSMKPFHEFRYGDSDGRQRGIFFSSGQEWTDQRRFSTSQLRDLGFGKSSMEDLLLEEANKLCSLLESDMMSTEVNENGEKLIELRLKTNISVVNALWVLLVGESLDLNDAKLQNIVKTLDEMLRSAQIASLFAILFPTLFKYFSPRFANAKAAADGVKSILRPIIEERRKADEIHDKSCFIDAYLYEIEMTTARNDRLSSFYGEKGLQSLEIVLTDMFMGGSETTSTSLQWAILYLLHFPEVQVKIQEELEAFVGHGNQVRIEHSTKLHYVNAFLAETLRFSALVPMGLPHYVTEDVIVSGYLFPKNTNIMGCLSYIHYNPEVWTNPENFDPTRFLNESGQFVSSRTSYMPFSIGKRYCIGQSLVEKQLFLFFCTLVQKFEFLPPKNVELANIAFKDDDENIGFVRQPPKHLIKINLRD